MSRANDRIKKKLYKAKLFLAVINPMVHKICHFWHDNCLLILYRFLLTILLFCQQEVMTSCGLLKEKAHKNL